MELTARDFLAAIENPKNFTEPVMLKAYLDPKVNAEGKRLVDERITVTGNITPARWDFERKVIYHSELDSDGVGWFEQAGWLQATKRGWTHIKGWEGRRVMLVWSGFSWRIGCLSDSLPLAGTDTFKKEPSYVAGLEWPRYTS